MKTIYLLVIFTTLLFSHNLNHTISKEQSVVVSFSFSQKDDFSFQNYEVYAPNSEIPFAVGRSDALSRVSFLPNIDGKWKVKAFSEDGHGKIVDIEVGKDMQAQVDTNSNNTLLKALIGLMILLGIFGLIYIKKKDNKNEKMQ
ncbi:MAG: LPXTG cell wall anchor domain-containing protein [Sulfurimonas sp.]|uniref:LPXTG cell wall anchor domain-containing protein n=1 Tax=Sulfurimonas sp. TaxID=2022749 RepID=UPI0025DA154B|nr:LPXTG cell wall anchor domain-containing protein [Sulfurimonas sp.]MCK9491637.1 LPXTG cell wall anchor domain-containing protein [Sulfurimonas sp.]